MIEQGDVWWADLGEPMGSEPGYVRPVAVIQGHGLNHSRLATVICIPMTTNIKFATAPGNVVLPANATGLDRDSVAQTAAIATINRFQLRDRVGRLSEPQIGRLFAGLDLVLGRAP